METTSCSDGIDRRVLANIRFNARRLAIRQAVPGMDVEDYEQDLACDLIRRGRAFNPLRGSYRTFADRVVGRRASGLARQTTRIVAEREAISLDAPVVDWDGTAATLGETLSDGGAPVDEQAMVRIDLGHFIGTLPAPLLEAGDILLAKSITAGASAAGIHRSTAHAWVGQLRRAAAHFGLGIYFGIGPDSSHASPVSGTQGGRRHGAVAGPEFIAMPEQTRPPRVRLLVDEAELRNWLGSATAGETLLYHRGALGSDRLMHGSRLPEEDRRELDRVAHTVFGLAEAGRGYLVQRRHGDGDYSYLFVLAPVPASKADSRTSVLEDVA